MHFQLEETQWIEQAACRGVGNQLFFSAKPSDIAEAKKFCQTCPVKTECLQFALSFRYNDIYGIWGGKGMWYRKNETARRGKERRSKEVAEDN